MISWPDVYVVLSLLFISVKELFIVSFLIVRRVLVMDWYLSNFIVEWVIFCSVTAWEVNKKKKEKKEENYSVASIFPL